MSRNIPSPIPSTLPAPPASAPDPLRGPCMTLHSGQRYYPFSPEPHDVTLEDEAHALAALPRFNGHARTFNYCVAHHSVLVSLFCEAIATVSDVTLIGLTLGLQGLHHDGGEFVACDLPAPIKHHLGMASYRQFEKLNQHAVMSRWRLGGDGKSATVSMADDFMLAIELRDLMAYDLEEWRQDEIDEGLKRLKHRAGGGNVHALQAANDLLHVVEHPGGLLKYGLYGQPAMKLFLNRHHDLVARRNAAEAADAAEADAAQKRERGR